MSYNDENRFIGIIHRIFNLIVLSFVLIYGAKVIMENNQITKLLPATQTRSLLILSGSYFSIVMYNYIMASKGSNFTNLSTELAIILINWILIMGYVGPDFFKMERVVTHKILNIIPYSKTEYCKNYYLSYILLLEIPLLAFLIIKLSHLRRRVAINTPPVPSGTSLPADPFSPCACHKPTSEID